MAANAATPPASTVIGLTVGESGLVSEADQQAEAVTISGTLSEALPAGDSVEILLPNGGLRQAIVAQDGIDFSLVVTGSDTISFSIPGQVSAFVADPNGNQSATFTQPFVAAAARTLVPVTSTPSDFSASGASALALSGDGNTVAFVANQTVGDTVQFGLYVEQLDTGTLTLVSAAGRAPSLSTDGTLVAYQASQNYTNQVFLEDLTTALVTQLSDPAGGSTSGSASTRPDIADNGTVVFESAGDTALDDAPFQQVFMARVAGGIATRTLISAAADGTPGNGASEYATISADGSTIVFLSNATNLLAAGDPHAADPHAAALDGTFQIYAYALRDNPATGESAGTVMLVSGNPDGTISDGTDYNPVVSGDGRFVLFQSVDANSQVHLADLLTGVSRIVSTNAQGVAANAGVFDATLSADGNTVVFQSAATNLLDPGAAAPDRTQSQQVYAKNLTTGQVTLLSEGGYTPGDAVSQDPAISADGTVAAFASTADNLTPGVLGSANRAPTSRGYVTTVTGTPALAIIAPDAAQQSTTVVLTGTIDPAHAETPITLTDATDPGFLPVTATVSAGSDPYADTWTATVIFTQAGAQTVTATAGGATVQATVTLLNPPSLTIDPVNGTGAITATGQPDHVTTVTGTNPAVIGGTVSLFLRTDDGKLLPLGTAATGADGSWSVSVPDTALGSQSSQSDALVAETVDANGNTIRAAEAIALSVPVPVTLYSYRFTYTDGSFYTGTVADDDTYGYTPGQTITTSGGVYVIGAAAGTTDQAPGTVTAASYFDVSTAVTTTPTAAPGPDGAAGLGSELDSIGSPSGLLSFGGGVSEAREATATAYGFAFVYNDGSAYLGTVVGGATSFYQAGQVLSTSNGFYQITGSQGAATAPVGTVNTSLYYDAGSTTSYVPVLYSQGVSSGSQGLGSELDSVPSASGSVQFGLAGADKAALRLVLTYTFHFFYPDGSVYYGYVVDDGTYGYSYNEAIKAVGGTYAIVAVSATPVAVGGSFLMPGEVSVFTYYDSSTHQYYEPGNYASGEAAGDQGLGSEIDYTTGISGNVHFGSNGTLEAKQAPNQLYSFTFTYKDGSYYTGSVVDDGSRDYYTGQTITTAYGHYSINSDTPLTVGEGGLVAGQVYTHTYYDISSGGPYQTYDGHANVPSGSRGLGSEIDSVPDTLGNYQTFGLGGQIEARLAPYTLLDFLFTYKDGSQYNGQLASDGVNGPKVGQIISTAFGYYDIYAYSGGTAAIPGTVTISSYYDVTDGKTYTPHPFAGASNFGTSGLSLAVGYTDGPLSFGYDGELEAKHAPNTSWEFQFIYTDGAYYIGNVVDNGQSGFHTGFIETTPYGYYNITGSTSGSSLPVGSVTLSYYYDVSTQKVYTPVEQGPQGIDGTSGLGSEYADTLDNGSYQEFGFGGAYEARQSEIRHYTFTFRYTDGSFYSGDYASYQDLYLPGTVIPVTGGYYNITALDDLHSGLPSGAVRVSSYFDIATGQFYTPVRYADGKYSGVSGLGSELDYLAIGSLRSFGGPTHTEANTSFATTLLFTPTLYAFDGPIQGATVGYLDPMALPGTLSIDPARPTSITNADGSYQLAGGAGLLVLTGGVDTATGLPFTGVLESAGTGSVLSPVTTLIEAVAAARGDTSLPGITAAEALVATALDLPAGLDLTAYLPGEILRDPTTGPDDIPAAEAVYRAGAKLLDAETLIAAAGGASQSAIGTVADALADGSITDLTDLFALVEDGGLEPQAETAIKTILTATNAALDQQLAGVTAPAAILALISGASIALQGNAATSLAAAGADDGTIATTYVQTLNAILQAGDQQGAHPTSTACYCRGTSILTATGEAKVEALRIGDRVMTASGLLRPIRWLGHRRLDCARHPHPEQVWPVRVRAGAFAADMPRRDLLLSPDHAVFADGFLVPIQHLINGRSIAQIPAASVEYWHVELDSHDVLFAEGLPAESYLDTGNRAAFANGATHVQLHPAFAAQSWNDACAELVQEGPRLIALKQRLFARAEIGSAPPVPGLKVIAGHQSLAPRAVMPGVWRYAVPPGARSLRLVSPRWMPAACIGTSLDRRQLGVRLLGVSIGEDDVPFDAPLFFSGFHPTETTAEGKCRWTDGDARLVLPAHATKVTLWIGDDANVGERVRVAA